MMSKYYKKPHKKSFAPVKFSVTYPNHKYSYEMPKHCNNRKGKKYAKYEWFNEEFWDLDPLVIKSKRYEVNLHWKNLNDAMQETINSDKWLYSVSNQEEYDNEKYNYLYHKKPRWRLIAPYLQEEIKSKHIEYNKKYV